MKKLTSRQKFAGILFLSLVLLVPFVTSMSAESAGAFEIYALYEDNKNLQAAGIGFGAMYGAGAAIGIICGIQLAVGILAVA